MNDHSYLVIARDQPRIGIVAHAKKETMARCAAIQVLNHYYDYACDENDITLCKKIDTRTYLVSVQHDTSDYYTMTITLDYDR